MQRKFPNGFFWGCATSSHQVEGNTHNDWSAWETSERRKFDLSQQGKNHEDFISGAACESFLRQDEDVDCLKQLGVNAYRFSVEWSRIEPEKGKIDQAVLDHYLLYIKKLKANGIEPFVTLWHWPVPLWVRDQGGWKSKKTVDDFALFVEAVVKTFGDEVKFWVTLNEPQVYSSHSFYLGIWPPQEKSLWSMMKVLKHLMQAHKKAFDVIKLSNVNHQVGIASHTIHFSAEQPFIFNQLFAKFSSFIWNDWFLKEIRQHQDFIGLNYYFRKSVDFKFGKNIKIESDLGWELFPEGLFHALVELKKYQKPVYILEHGLADKEDKHREWYIRESLAYAHKAIEKGVDLRGYFHWSLLDNFEWAEGFHPKFGLFEVDFKTCKRTARPSVAVYREIIKENGIDDSIATVSKNSHHL